LKINFAIKDISTKIMLPRLKPQTTYDLHELYLNLTQLIDR
jgi:hypothetical protein